jgi:hypothetical protein
MWESLSIIYNYDIVCVCASLLCMCIYRTVAGVCVHLLFIGHRLATKVLYRQIAGYQRGMALGDHRVGQ